MPRPDFLIIGVPKSGTTSVYHYLQQHPQIFMSALKEPHFFLFDGAEAPRMNGPSDAIRRKEMIDSWDIYQSLFDAAGEDAVCGEASVRYIYSKQACNAIYRRLPRVKLIVILRNPVDRAFSSYQRDRRHGTEPYPTFEQALDEGNRREAEGWFIGAHQSLGFYSVHLQNYFRVFGREQVRVYLHDDLREDAGALLRDIFGFLAVDTDFQPDLSVKYNITGTIENPFWRLLWTRTRTLRAGLLPYMPISWRGRFFDLIASKPVRKIPTESMSPATRDRLVEVYRKDIIALQDLIGRDLSHWLASGRRE
jgi:hypothetical protein